MSDNKEAILAKHISGCTCGEIYKSRDMPDPECFWCSYSDGAMMAMEEYAASIQSELDAERKEVERVKEVIRCEIYTNAGFDASRHGASMNSIMEHQKEVWESFKTLNKIS